MEICDQQFIEFIKYMPLVSIDVIVRDKEERILLGLRKKEPAKDTWFVPGGRIKKDDTLDVAFKRITKAELGEEYTRGEARFVGVFDNIYETNFLGVNGVGTHYVVIAYEIRPSKIPDLEKLPLDQHSDYDWFTKTDTENTKKDRPVHAYVLPYFNIIALTDAQYKILNARRDSFNSLVWRTPVLSLTAQAFLFTIALNHDVTRSARFIAAFLALITAIASIQLLTKHRFNEEAHAKLLDRFEKNPGMYAINKKSTFIQETWLENQSSFKIWLAILLGFAIIATIILIVTLFYPSLF